MADIDRHTAVAQAYVIATSTKVDVSGVKVDDKLNDDFFKAPKETVKRSNEDIFMKRAKAPKTPVSDDRKAIQKATDEALLASMTQRCPNMRCRSPGWRGRCLELEMQRRAKVAT